MPIPDVITGVDFAVSIRALFSVGGTDLGSGELALRLSPHERHDRYTYGVSLNSKPQGIQYTNKGFQGTAAFYVVGYDVRESLEL